MTDEELDAGLVERLRDALPGTCRKERCRPPLNSGVRCPCADPVLRILGALPIPAAALNAIARGEAVVALPGTMPPAQVRDTWMWQRGDTIKSEMWVNEGDLVSIRALAASPYRSEP